MIRSVRIRGGLLKPAASRFSAALPKQHLSSLQFSDVLRKPAIANSVALVDRTRDIQLTYAQLNDISSKLASKMAAEDLRKPFSAVGAFNKPSVSFVISMLAAWKLGKVFVPLSTTHTENELGYFIEDSKVGLVCCASKDMVNAPFLASLNLPLLETDGGMRAIAAKPLDAVERDALKPFLRGADSANGSVKGDTPALVIYTSGTTGRPKGVLHTHSSIYNMTTSLVQSWQYAEHDKILHFLPLYHVHGLVNKLLCMLYSGATVEFTGSAAAPTLWKRLAQEEHDYQSHMRDAQRGMASTYKPVSLFMAVPTVYARLLESSYDMRHDPVQAETLAAGVRALKRMRLMVCGSAALPDNVLQNWQKLTGYKLLERYGMTEIGMALSNPYEGERRQGYVGFPLPNVLCRLVDEDETVIQAANTPGELRIKGPQLFREYLNRPDATAESFDKEGWFRTGDVAEVAPDGYYKILGRNSTDIIKSAGYKLSALEIERELLAHPQILECAVLGVPDDILGERVLAVVALRTTLPSSGAISCNSSSNAAATATIAPVGGNLLHLRGDSKEVLKALRAFLHDKLAQYKQPREYVLVDAIPRNHLGKVNKKSLLKSIEK